MNVVLAYCLRDQEITLQLFEWIKELGGASKHQLLLCHDARCPKSIVDQISESARASFASVKEIVAQAAIDGWPQGANYMFKTCASHMEHTPGVKYFFWLEPDCVPLTVDWLDKIESEYLASGKAFMGDDVNVEVNGHQIPRHMSGVGVYQNPIHKLAGQINWANDTAWDMVGKDQIIPHAHFTKLIEHAWRHPAFTSVEELNTQIRPEAVLFHASKDGSLINILRQNLDTSQEPGAGSVEATAEATVLPPFTCDIFIRTYPNDYQWLAHCLASIKKFATGFRKIWVISTTAPGVPVDWVEWKVQNEETQDGYLAQQIHKLYADVITDYQADYILFMDSDTLFTAPVTPSTFFTGDKITWCLTAYDKIQTPWKPIIEKFMSKPVDYEFMRRHPMIAPRWLFPKLREYCFATHKMIISDYIRMQNYREFSEFNAMGAFAYQFYKDKFHWVNTLTQRMPPLVVRQFFSWGNITDEVKAEIDTILGDRSTTDKAKALSQDSDGQRVVDQDSVTQTPLPDTGEDNAGGLKPEPVPVQNNGELSVDDHIAALSRYADVSWKRQYLIKKLRKANLVPKWSVKKK